MRAKGRSVPALKRVAVLIETSRDWGRDLFRGVARYYFDPNTPNWRVDFEPRGYAEVMPSWIEKWQGDGILARINSRKMASVLLRKKLPIIDLRAAFDLGVPSVRFENKGFVRLALEHLRDLGLRRVAYCGLPRGQDLWIDDRGDEIARQAAHDGLAFHRYESKGGIRPNSQLKEERQRMANWVRELPRPIGIVACNDDRAHQVLEACQAVGAHVPGDVALMGTGNDEFLCKIAEPPLTSVRANVREVGYQAAEQLQRLMTGKRVNEACLLVQAEAVVPRKSTEMLAIDDAEVKQAVQFIRDHACERISVTHAITHVSLSRRRLEQRFQLALGRSLHDELSRVRLEHAQTLLSDTTLPMDAIARRVGIATSSHFCKAFKQRYGLTPGEYRERCRLEALARANDVTWVKTPSALLTRG
jgi:LacI family transcriptional regulator